MKTLLVTLILSATTAYAEVPKISCQINFVRENAQGIAEVFERGDSVNIPLKEEIKLKAHEFEATVKLEQICSSDTPECFDDYELVTIIKNGNVKTQTTTRVPFGRQYLNFAVGNESVFTLCDTDDL